MISTVFQPFFRLIASTVEPSQLRNDRRIADRAAKENIICLCSAAKKSWWLTVAGLGLLQHCAQGPWWTALARAARGQAAAAVQCKTPSPARGSGGPTREGDGGPLAACLSSFILLSIASLGFISFGPASFGHRSGACDHTPSAALPKFDLCVQAKT